mmetsp:Transcript_124915/g.233571  ORF Transcript_124915/g.233571 Transcript_124915/m.233571 type:complete len:455 (-) Transcript_124915:22-1386(-)
MAASTSQTMESINSACRKRGGKYAQYSCQVVSWDDVSRGEEDGALSCWGANITDTYLKSKDGVQLFTVRSENWNEKLGRVASDELALVAGNHVPNGELEPVTLSDFLKGLGEFGSYAGCLKDLSKDELDKKCSIRFQTTFLPVSGARGTLEFATEAYNYNTTSDDDPRNLVLLCTSQGVAVQQDGAGAKKLFHHDVDDDLQIHRYWLEAERSAHKVGGSQRESAEERADALKRGKATAKVIGTKAMGTRFNVLMTIQIPLKQKKPEVSGYGGYGVSNDSLEDSMFLMKGCAVAGCAMADFDMADECSSEASDMVECLARSSSPPPKTKKKGVANAARVSRGSEFDVWPGLSVSKPERHAGEHVTATVVMYNTVADGVPTEEDVIAAIDDLEALYEACGAQGQLADSTFDFMKKPLTEQDVTDIQTKLTTQPPQQAPQTTQSESAKRSKRSCVVS